MKKVTLKRIILFSTVILLVGSFPFFFSGCKADKYKVDYCGSKGCYSNAKDSYKAGSKVTLYFELIATDTDYSFTLDGGPVDWLFDNEKGFVIEFIMPEHDVKLECHSRNSMLPYDSE
ncbi:MAG: hypothetical protein IJ346_08080 [Clostridia bacterium]|nr:hypothetical protein [Clostridia bacterium]